LHTPCQPSSTALESTRGRARTNTWLNPCPARENSIYAAAQRRHQTPSTAFPACPETFSKRPPSSGRRRCYRGSHPSPDRRPVPQFGFASDCRWSGASTLSHPGAIGRRLSAFPHCSGPYKPRSVPRCAEQPTPGSPWQGGSLYPDARAQSASGMHV
jgi:hypothetical protein